MDIQLTNETKADLAKRLFAHIAERSTDRTDSIMEIDHREYLDPEMADRERREIFGRIPFVAAHGTELPEPRDFVTTQLPNNEALLVRQADGSVRAFVNVCRHRGARLVHADSGARKMYVCGYHGWSYAPDGALRLVTDADTVGEVDRSCLGLVELPCEERHGLIWVVDAAGAELDLDGWLGPELDAAMAGYGMAGLTCYRVGTFDEPINWKVLYDAFLDGYHLSNTHARSAAPYFYNNIQLFDQLGRHGRAIAPRRGIDRFLSTAPEEVPLEEHVTVGYSILPNTVILRQPDHLQLLTFLPHPSDVGRSRMQIRLLIPEPATTDEQRELWDKNWRILMTVLRDEDLELNRHLQRALANRDTRPLLLGRNEIVNQMFHRWLAEELGR